MVKFLIYSAILISLVVIQISILPFLSIYGSSPNILLVFCIILAFYLSNYRDLMIFSFISALVIDFYSGSVFGVVTLSFLATVIFAYFIFHVTLGKTNFAILFLGVIVSSALYLFLGLFIFEIINMFKIVPYAGLSIDYLIGVSVTMVTSLLLAIILFFPFRKYWNVI